MPPDAAPAASAPTHRLARSAGLSAAATLTSRLLGLVRDQVLAALFGAGNQMDAYVVAFRIPNLARDLFAEGAMSSAFVPTFTRQLAHRGRDAAWTLANSVLTWLVVITSAVSGVLFLFADQLVRAYAADYAAVPGKLELTIQLTRLMLPFLPLVTVAAAMMGMLNSLHHYFVPAAAPAMFNIATILSAFALVPVAARMGQPPIVAVAAGALLGGIGQVALQIAPLGREGFRYRPTLQLDAGLKRVLLLMGPGTIGLAAAQLNLLVATLLATTQGTGAVSWLTYAFRLMYLPIGLFGVSIATAVLPAAAEYAAAHDETGVRTTMSRGLMLMLVLNVPATAGLIALAAPIVRLLFERGQFSATDTSATAAALGSYAIGLVGYSAARIIGPVFYALGQSRVPVLVSVASVALNVIGSLVLVRMIGFVGLALATSLAALANGAMLLWLLRRHLGHVDGRLLASRTAKVAIASLLMGWTARTIEQLAGSWVPGQSVMAQSVRLGLAIGAGLTVLYGAARLLRLREFEAALDIVRSRVRKLLRVENVSNGA